jgi:AcrR family transcriptional regulator
VTAAAASAIQPRAASQRRNKGFEETHQDLIETAVRLISEKGLEALSIAALARAMGINRTTVYYHFESREALVEAVKEWSAQQLALGMDLDLPRPDRIGHISRFVLANPDLIRLWIEDFIAGGDIRKSYPRWDELVKGTQERFNQADPENPADAEVYCTMMMASAIVGPLVFRNGVAKDSKAEDISRRFIREHLRTMTRDGLAGPE